MSGETVGSWPPSVSVATAIDEARLVLLAAAAWSGTLLGLRQPTRSSVVIVAAAGAVITAGAALIRWAAGRPSSRRFVAATAVLTLIATVAVWRGTQEARAYQPMETGRLEAVAVLRGDPEPVGIGWRAEVQLESGERLEATGFGRSGFELRRAAVGDRLAIEGRIRSIGDRPWLRSRHIVGRVALDEALIVAPAAGFDRLVNGLRQVIVDGAASFDDRDRSLYTGLVIGDDRFQPLAQQAQFRASGLTHLLAVSGQNVAFVLLVVRPLLMAAGRRTRLVLIVGVLVVFVAVTRAEPSVLRAATTAGVATWAMVSGRTSSGLRTLCAGVAGLLLADPFLVDVVGFQLSVAASLGILIVSPLLLSRLATRLDRVPGAGSIGQALAVTIGAQIGVAPLLIGYFGPLPLASIPANLVAGWAAGAVMTLGLTVGPVSGLLHQARFFGAAAWLQWPSRLLVAWIDGTAGFSAGLGLPRVDLPGLAALALVAMALALRPRRRRARNRRAGRPAVALALLTVLMAVIVGFDNGRPQPTQIADGVIHLPEGPATGTTATVLVLTDPTEAAVDTVLAADIGRVDILVTERGDLRAATVVAALIEIVDVTTILGPPQHRIRGAAVVTSPIRVTTGWGAVDIAPATDGSSLAIDVPPVASAVR